MSSNDFEKIAASIRVHFCPLCNASFGCEVDDNDCFCIGQEYCDDWRKPHCPACYATRKEEEKCNCLTGQMTKGMYHHQECPRRDRDQPDQPSMVNYIQGLVMRDLTNFIGKPIGPYTDKNGDPCTACPKGECSCSACRSCYCADCLEERSKK